MSFGTRQRACCLLLAFAACAAPARHIAGLQVPPATAHEPRVAPFDVEHYAIELELDPRERSIDAICRVRLWPSVDRLRSVVLDLEDMSVSRVRDGAGRELPFEHFGGRLQVELAEPLERGEGLELAIEYGGQPVKGLWFAAEEAGVATQAFTHGQCEDARGWFPCFDEPSDRATSEVRVVIPAGWIALAAGERIDRGELADGRAFEHWRMATPHATYLTTLVAGEFALETASWNGVPLSFACAEPHRAALGATFAETVQMLDVFSELAGVRYPYPKYSQACVDNFLFGGMENISATTLTDGVLHDERGRRDYDTRGLVAHELAHQWFGDLLTCRDWAHIWLNESFATYAALLYDEATRGVDEFRSGVRAMQQSYLAADVGANRRPIVWNVYREPLDLFFEGHAYPGGASRLHYLRFVVGDDAFFRGLRRYVRDNAGRGVTTDDLERAIELESGLTLEAFFAQWFRQPGYPEFEVRWSWDKDARSVRLRVEQVQLPVRGTPAAFTGPAEVEIKTASGIERVRIEVEQRAQTFELPADGKPTWVVFDAHGWWPARIASARSRDEWLALLAESDDVNRRRDAAAALGEALASSFGDQERWRVAEALLAALDGDRCAPVRSAAARALGSVSGPADHPIAQRLATAAATDGEAVVRVAALQSLAKWGKSAQLADFGRAQFEAGFSYVTMAAAAALVIAHDAEGAGEWLASKLELDSPHDALRAELLNVFATLPGSGVIDELRKRALDESAGVASREVAVRNLGQRAKHLAEVRADLVGLLATTRLVRLQSALIDALGAIDDAAAREALASFYPRCADPRQRRAIERALAQPQS